MEQYSYKVIDKAFEVLEEEAPCEDKEEQDE